MAAQNSIFEKGFCVLFLRYLAAKNRKYRGKMVGQETEILSD